MKKISILSILFVLLGCSSNPDVSLHCYGSIEEIEGTKIESIYTGSEAEIVKYETKQVIPLNTFGLNEEEAEALILILEEEHNQISGNQFSYQITQEGEDLIMEMVIEDISKANEEELQAAGLQFDSNEIMGMEETKKANEGIGRTCKYLGNHK